MSNINDDISKLSLSELFGEDTDGDDDQPMDASSHQALEEESAGITTTTISMEELLNMSTEPPSEDLNAELEAEGEGTSALSGNNGPKPDANGDEAEGDDDGEDHRRSDEDETTCPPESANMEVVEKKWKPPLCNARISWKKHGQNMSFTRNSNQLSREVVG